MQRQQPHSVRLGLLVVAVLLVAGCSFGAPATQKISKLPATSGQSQAASLSETDAAACRQACERSYTICMDGGAARRDRIDAAPNFGAAAGCETSLRRCLPRCGQ